MKKGLQDFVIQLKNNLMIKKSSFIVAFHPNYCKILGVLWDEGFIRFYKKLPKNKLYVRLKYSRGVIPAIKSIKLLSKPGSRFFLTVKQLWKINSVKTTLIISTNKGFMSLSECKKKKIGGEPLFAII